MDSRTFKVPIPSWAEEELKSVHGQVREALPEALQSLWDTEGFGLAGFDRAPLRPYLVLLAARHYGCTGPRPLRLATSIHMIHMASLLHDRLGWARKAPGAVADAGQELHQREALDILVGDFFFSRASGFIVDDGDPRIIQEHIRTSLESAETQASLVGLDREIDKTGPAECFEVVADKVSLLLALSLRVGAILGNARREEEEALSGYGFLLGRVVRILEDLATWERLLPASPYLAPDTRFSHPLILLWEKEGRKAWEAAARRLQASDERDLRALQALLGDRGYLAASRGAALGLAEKALGRLNGLAATEERRWIEAVARFHFSPRQGQEVPP